MKRARQILTPEVMTNSEQHVSQIKIEFRHMKRLVLFLLLLLTSFLNHAQNDNTSEDKQIFNLSGYVKNDFFWDSRQTVTAREGHFLLWPSAINEDTDGNDINAVPSFNYLSLQSRLSFTWKGTEALGAKISAKIESDFFAQNNENINLFRLRHAYAKMKWENTELLLGQYWIPMFTTECFPGTVSFNTGTPFNPFGRNPQIRLSHSLGNIKLTAVANSQRDYSSRGPDGTSGKYLSNSLLPELTGIINYKTADFSSGFGAAFKQIVPQIITDQGFATDQTLKSYSAFGFVKLKTPNLTLKLKGIYGQNTPDYLSISGFAVTDYDALKGYQQYEPISNISTWADISTNDKEWQVGIFGGYTKNLGTKSDIVGDIYGLGTNIANLYRVSPRLVHNSGKMRFSTELEYTVADYGTIFDAKNVALTTQQSSNLRLLFAVYYFFDTKK